MAARGNRRDPRRLPRFLESGSVWAYDDKSSCSSLAGGVGVGEIAFRVLGSLEVVAGGRILPLGGQKPRLLLASLLLQPNTAVGTDALVEVLWPAAPPRSAVANLRTYAHALRARLAEADPAAGARIHTRSSGYVLSVHPGELDVVAFEDHVEAAKAAMERSDPATALDRLGSARALWRGRVLEDLPDSQSWGPTLARLHELRMSVIEQSLRIRVSSGQYGDAIAELRGLLADHPLREELWRQLILALTASGRKAEALHAYADAERIIHDELGTGPGVALRQAIGGAALPEAAFPVCQLPLDLRDFTGRTRLVKALIGSLRRRGNSPAVAVLTGPPGAGKSAVVVHVGHTIRESFPDGQLYVDLGGTSAAPREPADVLAELLRALGVPDAVVPRGIDERAALYRSRLARRRVFVVLDDAAGAAQVRPLLPGSGGCAVLVTSRVRMPELYPIPQAVVGMLTPTEADEMLAAIIGAERVAAEPQEAAEIVRSCGHLPLAIRVAGAKLSHRRAWSLRSFADRLRDERRRLDELRAGDLAVRASVELSYELLPADAARGFRLLGLLGPCRLPEWTVPVSLGDTCSDVLDVLADAHLVELVGADVAGQPRFRLHDLLRCYAVDLVVADPVVERREAVRRVVTGYLELVTRAVELLPVHFFGVTPRDGPSEDGVPADLRPAEDRVRADPMTWLDAECRTLTAMAALAAEHGLPDLAWRIPATLAPYFELRRRNDEWERTHRIALENARLAGDVRGQAMVLRNLGQLHVYRDSYPEGLAAFEESLRLFSAAGDERGRGVALVGIGTVLRICGEADRALDRHGQALEAFLRVSDRNGEATARIAIGTVWASLREFEAAEQWLTEGLRLAIETGDRHREANAHQRFSALRQAQGDYVAAREHLDLAMKTFEDLHDDHCVDYARHNIGELCLRAGDLASAGSLLTHSLDTHRRSGDRRSEAEVAALLGELHQALGSPRPARAYFGHAMAMWRQLSELEAAVAARRPGPDGVVSGVYPPP